MAKNIVQLHYNSDKHYEMDKAAAVEMLDICRQKAACLHFCSKKLFGDNIDGDNPVAEGFSCLMSDLADELEIVSKTLMTN